MVWQRIVYNLVFFLIAGCSSVNPVDAILQPINDVASLDLALAQLIKARVAPGLTVAVVKNGAPVYVKAFGYANASQSAPVQIDSGFNLWSVSKVFTQLAILDLVNNGRLQLDDPVCMHLEWLEARACRPENSQPNNRTIRMLLDHTGGIPDIGLKLYGETQFDTDEIPNQKALAKRLISASGRWSEPGVESRYSNSHYLLLAAIVEHISGQTFSEYVHGRVLDPLGLVSTGFRYPPGLPIMFGSHPADMTSFFAFFYVDKLRAVSAKQDGRYWFNKVYNSSLGSTGLVSNGHDMTKFMTAMLTCLGGSNGPIPIQSCARILQAHPVPVTESPARGVVGLTQQLGWFVYPTSLGESFVHGGSGMAYTSMLQLFPAQRLGVFVVANDSYFDHQGGLAVATAVSKIKW